MLQTLLALLFLLSCRQLEAMRPQEKAAKGATESLAIGHSAALQHDHGRGRLQHSGPLAASEQSLAEVATAPSVAAATSVAATPPVAATTPVAATPSVAAAPTVAAVPKGPPKEAVPQHHSEQNASLKELPSDPIAETGPVAQLLGEAQVAPTAAEHDSTEAGQELDDTIKDEDAAWAGLNRIVRPLAFFFTGEVSRHLVLNVFIYAAAVFIAMGLYVLWFQHREVPKEQDFRYGIFGCLGDFRVCLCGFVCPAIRWADTVSEGKGGSLSFGTAFLLVQSMILIIVGLTIVSPWAGAFAWLSIIVTGVFYRQRIRDRCGLESDTLPSYLEDFFVWCCLPGCAVCQEARQVDENIKDLDSSSEKSDDNASRSSGERPQLGSQYTVDETVGDFTRPPASEATESY